MENSLSSAGAGMSIVLPLWVNVSRETLQYARHIFVLSRSCQHPLIQKPWTLPTHPLLFGEAPFSVHYPIQHPFACHICPPCFA